MVSRLLKSNNNFHKPDKQLLWALGIVIVFGLIMLFSASAVAGYLRGSSLYFFKRQLLGLALGIPVFLILARLDYHKLKPYATTFLVLAVILAFAVYIPGLGANYNGATNWLNIFGFSLQPSEFVKLLFLIYLAVWLESKHDQLNALSTGLGPFLLIFGIVALPFLKQDLGTLSILFAIAALCYFVAGAPRKQIVAGVLIAAAVFAVSVNSKTYKIDRIECYLHPEMNTSGSCYQVNQSLIAIGSGGFFGRGLGESREKFMYLPEVWSDSIFPVIAEEIGFIFSGLLIALFVWIFYRAYLIARAAPDNYGRILAIGIGGWIMIQAFINIGGATNLIPMTGVPLPFVSSGGSALLALLAAVGILVNISRQTRYGRDH